MQEEVAAEVAADDVSTTVLSEKHDGLIHLVVCYETAGRIEELSFSCFKQVDGTRLAVTDYSTTTL